MQIDRCVCANRSFASLLAQAKAAGLSFQELAEATDACRGCGLCEPYVRRAMRTGQTVFTCLLREQDEPPTESPAPSDAEANA